MTTSSMIVIIALIAPFTFAEAGSFLRKELNTVDAEKSLVSELAGTVSEGRLVELEDALRATFDSLPKGTDGQLGHQGVRYVLHRLFVQRHSWYIKGLEPSDDVPPPYLGGEWVPAYLQGLLEQRLGDRGINLHELAALAASLEDLVHKEAASQLATVYDLHGFSVASLINTEMAQDVLSTYMMLYLKGGNFTAIPAEQIQSEKQWFAEKYADYSLVEDFLQTIEAKHMNSSYDRALSFASTARIAGEISERFGFFNDRECRSLKTTLLEIEDQKLSGRVRLSDFYKKGLYSHWQFNEKVGYLRALGALDESDPNEARVLVPNYLTSRSNCLEASSLYAVCCRNECEDLMGHLESVIAAPTASLGRVTELVGNLESDTVVAPRNLSTSLLVRLGDIADSNGGKIPLHGRLFAQWMHHAFPRECPYPHETGTVSPQTPDEWIKETGEDDHRTSEEDLHQHVANATYLVIESKPFGGQSEEVELPWSNVEEHFAYRHALPTKVPNRSADMPFLLQLVVSVGIMMGAVCWARQRTGQMHYFGALAGAEKPSGLAPDPEADIRAFLVFCTVVAAANSAGLLHKAAFGCSLYGGFVLVALPLVAKRGPSRATMKPESCRV